MFKKPGNRFLIYLATLFILFLSFFLIGFITIRANSPDAPSPVPANTNITVCIDPPYPNISNPRQPIFSWTTSGKSQVRYWLQVDNNQPENNVFKYQRDFFVWDWLFPRCPCDTNQKTLDCPNSFPATAADPRYCYDQFEEQSSQFPLSSRYKKNFVRIGFPSPEIDRNIASGNKFYQTPVDLLPRKTTYWYRIAVKDAYGWTGWTGCNSFYLPGVPPNPPSNLNVSQPDYCRSGLSAIFSWQFSDPDPGDTQSAYQVQVDNNSDFSSPEDDSGKAVSSSNSYATPPGKLSYNTTYYWRVRIWDTDDLVSDWTSGPSFTTPRHAYPSINFSWTPQEPSVNEIVQFIDQSTVYGGATKSSWYWTFQDGEPAVSTEQNPQTKFLSSGPKTVTLKITDSDGFACTGQKSINSQLPLPEWKEIAPF